MSTTVDRHPMNFAGLPGSSWAFAIRIWLAIVVALYVSFWLELEAPSSAAVTVAILALPTRGQVLGKAVFRLIATVLGVTASIGIVGIFAQTEGLLLAAFAVWLGLCVYAVGLLDGNRAYAAALSGYTVAIIAVEQIDSPQHVFESGMARGAAIVIGVLAVTVVNDFLAVPDQQSRLAAQLGSLHRRVTDYVRRALNGGTMPAATAVMLLGEVVALRPEINSLAAELDSGPVRSAAARSVMVGVVAELFAIRALMMLPVPVPPALRARVMAGLEDNSHATGAALQQARPSEVDAEPHDAMTSALAWFAQHLLQTDREVRVSLAALAGASSPPKVWRAPLYQSHRIAAVGGIRAAVCFLLAAVVFALCGWSSSDVSLSFIAIILALGATTPDPRAFTTIALVAVPIASLMAGVLEFVVLDGATAFPLLAIALAPFMIGAALLMTLPNKIISAIGRLNLVFILVLVAPSNPQSYNPQTFLFSVLFLLLATGLLFVAEFLIPPLSRDRRLQWLLASVCRELHHLPSGQKQHLAPEEAMFRDASRISQILAVSDNWPGKAAQALASFEMATALRLCEVELNQMVRGPLGNEARAACAALAARDFRSVMASAHALKEAAAFRDMSVDGANAGLSLAVAAFGALRPRARRPA